MSPILGHTLLLKGDLQKTTNRLKLSFDPFGHKSKSVITS